MSSQDREAVEDVTAVQIQRDRSGYAELHHAASYDDIESFEKLVAEHGTQIIFEKTNRGLTSIHVAAVSNSIRIMRKLVELLPTNMFTDHITNYQESPLHLASAANNRDIVKLLLDKGIDPILVDCWGRTAATVAAQNGYTKIVDLFRSYGIVASTKEHVIMNVKESLPIRKQLLTDFQQQLQLKANATKTFQEPIVKTIFSTPLPSANFNTTSHADNGALSDHSNSTTKRSLSKLVEFPGDPEKVKLLVLDETIDLDGKDMFGLTALHKVCAWDKVDLLAILLPYLSMEQVNSVGGKEGYYPLHHCVALGAKRTLQYLLTDPRVDIQLKDKANRTYIELASETNQLHLLEH